MENTGQRGLTLKIAAGVFIGIMAALLVYSIPGWVRKHQEEQRASEKLDRDLWLERMTPEQFPSRCGKLLKDQLYRETSISPGGKVIEGDRFEARDVTVEVTKLNGKKEAVTAEYMNLSEGGEEPRWDLRTIGGWKTFDDDGLSMLTYLYSCLRKPSP
jgi:hypothetical protein